MNIFKKSLLLLLGVCIGSVSWAAAPTYHFTGKFPEGEVRLTLSLENNNLYVTQFEVHTHQCGVTLFPHSRMNTQMSVNWFPFGWDLPNGGRVTGVIAPIKTYIESSIVWHLVQTESCQIPDERDVKLVLVK